MRNVVEDRTKMCIYMPVMVIFCNTRLVEMTADEFSDYHARAGERGRVLFSNASNSHFRVTELLDRKGYFYRVAPVVKRRSLLGWFAPIWDFTKMECDIERLGPLPVGELLKEANKWKNESGRKVCAFLAQQDPNCLFNEMRFRAAWQASYIPLPEPEWQRSKRASVSPHFLHSFALLPAGAIYPIIPRGLRTEDRNRSEAGRTLELTE